MSTSRSDVVSPVTVKSSWKIVGLLVIAALGWMSAKTYAALDSAGWIVHNHDTRILIKGDWPDRKYLVCGMLLSEGGRSIPISDKSLDCPEGMIFGDSVAPGEFSHHVFLVRYHGRIDRSEKWFISWRCRRDADSLTCEALD